MQHDIYSRGLTEPCGDDDCVHCGVRLWRRGRLLPRWPLLLEASSLGLLLCLRHQDSFEASPIQTACSHIDEVKKLLAYALPIGADQFLNAFIWRVDVIILGCFVGRAPGVTLTTLGIYGAVVGLANGLRRVSQPFTPIFAPVVASMTATGAHREAGATYSRLLQWMLWILFPATAVMILAGDTIMRVYGPGFQQGGQWLAIVAIACATNAFVNLGETVIMVQRPGLNLLNSLITCAVGSTATFFLISQYGVMGAAFGILVAACAIQALIRTIILHFVFHWPNPWHDVLPNHICRNWSDRSCSVLPVMFPKE